MAKTIRRFEKNFSLCFVTTQMVFFCNCEPLWVFASSGLSVVNWESMCAWRGRSASKSMHCSRGGLESGFRHWWLMTTHYFSSRRSHAIVLPLWAPHIHFYNTPIYIYNNIQALACDKIVMSLSLSMRDRSQRSAAGCSQEVEISFIYECDV